MASLPFKLPSEEARTMKSRTERRSALLRHLVAAREKAGISQRQLAKRLQVGQSFVAKYEKGIRGLEILQFLEICDALEVSSAAITRAVHGESSTVNMRRPLSSSHQEKPQIGFETSGTPTSQRF